LSGTTQDQRDISFKYRFGPSDWEADTWIRTVPATAATELWTQDFSARCATQAPGPPAAFPSVTVNAITQRRFNGGAVWVWTPTTNGALYYQSQRNDGAQTSSFVVPITGALQSGFYFKLVGSGGQSPFSDFEDDTANRFWEPSDGANIWVKSGQVDVQSQAIVPVSIDIDLFFPLVLGTPLLRIQDLIGDFDSTVNPVAPEEIDLVFGSTRYSVSVYSGALYNVWWSTEPQTLARRFRVPMGEAAGPSIAVNGYDHWLAAPPSPNGSVDLIIHPNPGSTFAAAVGVQVGIGAAPAHQILSAESSADGTWLARLDTFPGVPFWTALVGESRPDGPLDFRRGIMSKPGHSVLHTIDGVGGASASQPGNFVPVDAATRASLMKAVYGEAIVDAGVFDPWEMPHGVNKLNDTVYFVVRAPHAVTCSVLQMATPNATGTPRSVSIEPMSLTEDLRYWWASASAEPVSHGGLYRFAYSDRWELLSPRRHFGEADPASRWHSTAR
jgi:hypothetical protein